MKRGDLTLASLRKVLLYDPNTGFFTRLSANGRTKRRLVGERAGSFDSTVGYRRIRVNGHIYLEHRLACFWMTGEWPKYQVDHCDGNRANNAWANLRTCTQSQNQQNLSRRKNNTSGAIGVSWDKRRQVWRVQIQASGHLIHLGTFEAIKEASEAYLRAKRDIHKFNPFPRQEVMA